jgi:hypothetical protein
LLPSGENGLEPVGDDGYFQTALAILKILKSREGEGALASNNAKITPDLARELFP